MSAISGPSGGGPAVPQIQGAQKALSGLAGLKTGDTLKALVVKVLSGTEALLDIGGKTVAAKTEAPLSFAGMEGKSVLLKALGSTPSGEPLLKLEGELSSGPGLSGLSESEAKGLLDLLSSGPAPGGEAAFLGRLENLLQLAGGSGDVKMPAQLKSALEDALLSLIKSGDAGGESLYDLIMAAPQDPQVSQGLQAQAGMEAPASGLQFLPSVENLTGPALEKAVAESGILLETNLLDLVKGVEAKIKNQKPSGPENDLKALALKLQEGAGSGKEGQSAAVSGRLLRDIRAYQLLSRLTGSLYSFLPVRWPGLKEGLAGFKSGGAGASCLINLDLEGIGKINISVLMRDGGFYVTLRVENAGFREALSRETGQLEGMLSEKGLLARSVNVTGYEGPPGAKRERENHLEFRGVSKSLINIRL